MNHDERQKLIRDLARQCGRCDSQIGEHWSNGWPNYGTITLGYASQIFAVLRGHSWADEEDFQSWKKGHSAMTINDAQKVQFAWGPDTPYRLCRSCQAELIRLVGRFFGLSKEGEDG
jgi:hypothetical protein